MCDMLLCNIRCLMTNVCLLYDTPIATPADVGDVAVKEGVHAVYGEVI